MNTFKSYDCTRVHMSTFLELTPKKPNLRLNEKYSDCNWHSGENTESHKTNEYVRTDNALVVRRGRPFKEQIKFQLLLLFS